MVKWSYHKTFGPINILIIVLVQLFNGKVALGKYSLSHIGPQYLSFNSLMTQFLTKTIKNKCLKFKFEIISFFFKIYTKPLLLLLFPNSRGSLHTFFMKPFRTVFTHDHLPTFWKSAQTVYILENTPCLLLTRSNRSRLICEQ